MPTVFGNGSPYVYTQIPSQQTIVTQTVISHDQKVILDNDASNVDKSHLYLEGPLAHDEYYIRAHDPNQGPLDQFNINKDGDIVCGTILSETITSLQGDIVDNEDVITAILSENNIMEQDLDDITEEIENATHEDDVGTLVRRGQTDTQMDKIICRALTTGENNQLAPYVSLYGDSILYYIPKLANGQEKPNCVYRFGHNHEEVGDFSGSGAGLEFQDDGEQILIQVSKSAATIRIVADKDVGQSIIQAVDPNDANLFRVDENGNIDSIQLNDLVSSTEDHAAYIAMKRGGNSQAHGDGSLYVGSAKIHFNRAAYELRHRTLATAHIPKYLQDAGFTVGDLPSGVTINDLSCLEWIRLARTYVNNNYLDADHVFPAANVGVDFGGLVDFPNTANTTAIATNVTNIASNVTDIATNTTAISGLGSGSSGSTREDFAHMTTYVQLADDITVLHWGRHQNGTTSGGNGRYILPSMANFSGTTHTFEIHSHNPVGGTGEIQLKVVSGHTFNVSADDQPDLQFNGAILQLKNSGRNSYKVMYRHSTTSYYVRQVSAHNSLVAQVGYNTKYFKWFSNLEVSYPEATPFQIPDNYMNYHIMHGDGSDWSTSTTNAHGPRIYLPISPMDGATVEIESTIWKNTSTAQHVITICYDDDGNPAQPAGRLLNYVDASSQYHSITPDSDTNISQKASNYKSRRDTYHYVNDLGTNGAWIHCRDLN